MGMGSASGRAADFGAPARASSAGGGVGGGGGGGGGGGAGAGALELQRQLLVLRDEAAALEDQLQAGGMSKPTQYAVSVALWRWRCQ